MKVIGILLLIGYVVWGIVRRLRPKEKRYVDYIKKGVDYETYFRYEKALGVYREALTLPHLTPNQKSNLEWSSGHCLVKLKRYKEAVSFFDRAFYETSDLGPFHYTGQLKRVIKGYLLAGEREKAQKLYEDLMKRSNYDRRFKRLKRLGVDLYSNGEN